MLNFPMVVPLVLFAFAGNAAPAKRLTFADAIEYAAASSPRKEESQAEYEVQAAQKRKAVANLGPKVRGKYSDVKFNRDVTLPFGTETFLIRPDKLREGSIEVIQPISGLITGYQQIAAANAREDASALGVEQTKVTIFFEAASAYMEAQATEEHVYIAQTSETAAESQLKDAQALTTSGRMTQTDLLKIKIATQEARALIAKNVAQKKKALARLLYLTNLQSGTELLLDPVVKARSVNSFVIPSVDASVEKAIHNRLDLKRANANVEVAEHAQQLARLKFMPTIDFFASWGRIYSTPPFGNPNYTQSYGVSATWDLWDSGSRLFETDEASAQVHKANSMQQETKDRMKLEIQGILADLEAAKEMITTASAAVEHSEEAYRLDKARFSNGLVTTTDLLLSEATRTRVKGVLVDSIATFNNLILTLQKASGESKPQNLM